MFSEKLVAYTQPDPSPLSQVCMTQPNSLAPTIALVDSVPPIRVALAAGVHSEPYWPRSADDGSARTVEQEHAKVSYGNRAFHLFYGLALNMALVSQSLARCRFAAYRQLREPTTAMTSDSFLIAGFPVIFTHHVALTKCSHFARFTNAIFLKIFYMTF